MRHDPGPDERDDFTARLRAQPPAELPAHWRTDILAAASSVARSFDRPARRRHVGVKLAAWLWPHPLAYAGLAAAWAFILTLRLYTVTPQPVSSLPGSGPTAIGVRTPSEDRLPIFESVRLASQESSWDSTVVARP